MKWRLRFQNGTTVIQGFRRAACNHVPTGSGSVNVIKRIKVHGRWPFAPVVEKNGKIVRDHVWISSRDEHQVEWATKQADRLDPFVSEKPESVLDRKHELRSW